MTGVQTCALPISGEVSTKGGDDLTLKGFSEMFLGASVDVAGTSQVGFFIATPNISICGCPDCADDDHDPGEENEELLAEGKPLIANRPIQIIVGSGICFAAGHILEFLSFNPTIVTLIFMLGALIAGYEIAILAYNSLVKRHTIGPAMLMCIACVASFIIGHG